MIKKEDKKQIIKDLADKMSDAKSFALINYTGMDVKAQEELKNKLRDAGGTMLVAKNTLIKLAIDEAKLKGENLDEVLAGQTAIVFPAEDPVAPVQTIGKFREEFETPEFKAGFLDGNFYEKEGMLKISKLPTKDELNAQVVGAAAAPMYALIGSLNSNLQKLVYVLKQAQGGE